MACFTKTETLMLSPEIPPMLEPRTHPLRSPLLIEQRSAKQSALIPVRADLPHKQLRVCYTEETLNVIVTFNLIQRCRVCHLNYILHDPVFRNEMGINPIVTHC